VIKLSGSWVALPTPFTKDDQVDYQGFATLIERQIKYGSSQLFVLGSAGEVTLLTLEEKRRIVAEVAAICRDRIPVFFSATAPSTREAVDFARCAEKAGADGVVFTAPPYVLAPQPSVLAHLDACMGAVSIPCGIYNNPARLGTRVEAESIRILAERHENFVVDKEATGDVSHLVQVQRLAGEKVKIMCCDAPGYAILLPTLAIGGSGAANISGNIIPEETALFSRPWTDIETVKTGRAEYFKWFPLLELLYEYSNPIVIKAALDILGLPGGRLRAPYQELGAEDKARLAVYLNESGVAAKYGGGN
jgi:4-hydroxy-tetrahydrodipicolinate synthase